MQYQGVLTKMQTEFGNPIQYYLIFENSFLNVNQVLGKEITIQLDGYQCLNCGKKRKFIDKDFATIASIRVHQWVIGL